MCDKIFFLCKNYQGEYMKKIILIRHGQSIWNLENRFTGWTDVELSANGIIEATNAGELLKTSQINIDIGYTSVLKRAKDTMKVVQDVLGQKFPVYESYKLNERHYGALQGLNKAETAKKYGDEQVLIWRRSAETRPPLLEQSDSRNPAFDSLYKGIENLPLGENLIDTKARVVDYYQNVICPSLHQNQNVLIVAHGNSLRALMQHLDNISNQEIMKLEIPTGKPIVYELTDNLEVIKHYY